MGVGPRYAIPKLLDLAGMKTSDIGLWEINEAFASQALYCAQQIGVGDKKLWASDSPDKIINVNGGAIATGHPLGATGARMIVTLIHALRARGLKRGIASQCIGGGEATAVALEID